METAESLNLQKQILDELQKLNRSIEEMNKRTRPMHANAVATNKVIPEKHLKSAVETQRT
jgi:hypothetical protein